MFGAVIISLKKICFLGEYISSLTDDEFKCLMRQFDKANLFMEYIQWEK